MGNKVSSPNKDNLPKQSNDENNKIIRHINHIAANYIYSMTFDDLVKLDKPEYCEKIAILTGKAIKSNLKDLEISYLVQKIKNGKPIYHTAKANVVPLQKEKINELDISNKFLKNQACKGIGKYYVKIAHVFASIVKAVNPLYIYKDINGIKQIQPLSNKKNISDVYKPNLRTGLFNICSRRIQELKPTESTENRITIKRNNCTSNIKGNRDNILMVGGAEIAVGPSLNEEKDNELKELDDNLKTLENEPKKLDESTSTDDIIPKIIKANEYVQQLPNSELPPIQKNNNDVKEMMLPSDVIETKTLADEPGIKELEKLYYDEINLKDNKISFDKMSEKSKEEYNKHLYLFYTTFTGKKELPKEGDLDEYGQQIPLIKSFSDIKLKDFHNQELCQDPNSKWNKSYTGKPTDKLFAAYANHLKNMINKTKKYENKLLDILGEIFVYDINHPSKQITINSKMNEDVLNNDIIPKTRNIITELYIQCEKDYQKGLSIFEGIIKSKMIDSTINKVEKLNKLGDELIGTDTTQLQKSDE